MKVCSICRRCFEDDAVRCVDSTHAPALEEMRVPLVLGDRWRIERLVTATDWSAEFVARHIELGRAVAIRISTGEGGQPPALGRARLAARSLAAIRHESVARLEDFGTLPGGGSFAAIERLGEESLREAIGRVGPLPVPDSVRIARQIADGLAALAAHAIPPAAGELTAEEIRVGRDAFGAPFVTILHFPNEDRGDGSDLVPRIGAVLYEMLAGRPPGEPAESVMKTREGLNESLAWLVDQSLHRSAALRPRSIAEVARRLREAEKAAGEPAGWTSPAEPVTSGVSPEATVPIATWSGGGGAPRLPPRPAPVTPVHSMSPAPPAPRETPVRPVPAAVAIAPPAASAPLPARPPGAVPVAAPPALEAFPIDNRSDRPSLDGSEGSRGRRSSGRLWATLGLIAAAVGAASWLIIQKLPPRPATGAPDPSPTATSAAAEPTFAATEVSAPGGEPSPGRPTEAPGDVSSRPAPSVSAGPPAPLTANESAVRAALDRWVSSTNDRRLDEHMTSYMPRLSTFYLERNVSRDVVRRVKSQLFALGPVDIRVRDPEITVTRDGRAATVRFRKDYQVGSQRGPRRGAVIQELKWIRSDKGWKIVSERDARVLDGA